MQEQGKGQFGAGAEKNRGSDWSRSRGSGSVWCRSREAQRQFPGQCVVQGKGQGHFLAKERGEGQGQGK